MHSQLPRFLVELFSLSPTVEPLRANIEWKSPFLKLGGSVCPKISGRKGRPLPTILCVRKTTWIYLSYGIRISAVSSFVLSQFTRVTDGQTDRWTDTFAIGKTALHICSAVETCLRSSNHSHAHAHTHKYTHTGINAGALPRAVLYSSSANGRRPPTTYYIRNVTISQSNNYESMMETSTVISQMPKLFIGTSGTPIQYVTLFCCWSVLIESDLSDTDNIVPFENTTPINLINLLCVHQQNKIAYSMGVPEVTMNWLGNWLIITRNEYDLSNS